MPRIFAFPASLLAGLMLAAPAALPDDWTSIGADAQRSSWVRADRKTSPQTVRAPDFRLLWKLEMPNEARSGNALSAPALLDFLISHRGFRSLAFVGGSSGGVYVVDTDLARMEWERQFLPGPSGSSPECPGGMTASLTRPTDAAMPSALGFLARGRRSPAMSAVGNPNEGAVTLVRAQSGAPTPQAGRPATSRVRPQARPSLRGVTLVYALSSDGMLHALYASNGRDRRAPLKFVPPNANARGLIVVGGTAYVATANGCAEVPDGVWAIDLKSGSVRSWQSKGGSVVGPTGLAFSPDGTLYAATREGPLVALDPETLEAVSATQATGFRSAPVVFDHAGEDRVAAVGADGSVRVYAAATLEELAGGPPAEAPSASESALAVWRDHSGTQWILAPSQRSITAWKLLGDGASARIERGWESPAMDTPLPPIVVNGVVFALDGGSPSGPARLHAIEGSRGEPLWDSGDAITSAAKGHTLASGPGHVYLSTADSTLYAFGFPMEH